MRPPPCPRAVQSGLPPPARGKLTSKTGVTKNGPSKVAPPSRERTNRYWFSSGVLKFWNATPSSPVFGCTVGTENWLSSHAFGPSGPMPMQNVADPLIGRAGDHERAWSSDQLIQIRPSQGMTPVAHPD